MSTLGAGMRHLRQEWGRWWRAEDLTDTHIAHRILNDQYRMWQRLLQRQRSEVQQNLSLLKTQQKQATYMQMQRMQMQKHARGRGYGYGGFGGFGGGASPMISYRMMQWAQLQMRLGQEEFKHLEVTPSMLAIGRGQVRSRRHWAAAGWFVALPGAWVGLWLLSAVAGLAVTAAVALVVLVMAWARGRNPVRRRPPVPKLLFVPPAPPAHTELAPETAPDPFPLREAGRDPRRAREAVELAGRKEKAQIGEVGVPTESEWGWTVPLVLSGGTLADLIRVLPRMATTLRVGGNRLLAQPASREDSAAVTLRMLLSDPFENPLPVPDRAPRSTSISNPFSLGLSIDGETTPVILRGQHVLVVSDSGGGKSTLVRAMADFVTACRDAVAVDVDPTGRGLGPFGPCAARRGLSGPDAERELEFLLGLAQARVAALGESTDNWEPSAEAPAVVAFVDEWHHLSKKAKATGLTLQRIGRKAAVSLVLITTDATSDVVGDAVADAFGVRIMLPCRAADVPLVVGQADAISKGWLPHLLVPSPGPWEPADAGRFYCITPRHRDPILRYVSPLEASAAAARAKDRVTAGLLQLTAPAAVPAQRSDVPPTAALLLSAFAAEENPEILTVAQIADHLGRTEPAVWAQWDGRKDRVTMVGRALKNGLQREGLSVPTERASGVPGRPTAYRLADVRQALQ